MDGLVLGDKKSMPPKNQFRLSKRFYLISILLLITIITGLATGFPLFFRLTYILCVAIILTFVWNLISVKQLSIKVDRRTERVHVGEPLVERITAINDGFIPKSSLIVEDMADIPGYSSAHAIDISSKSFRSWRTTTPARKRGIYKIGPIKVSSSDTLGLYQRDIFQGNTSQITVYPRLHTISGFDITTDTLYSEGNTTKRAHILTPHASSIRDYEYGDSISRVHWKSSAKHGKLMSREFDIGRSNDIWTVVDLDTSHQYGSLDNGTDEIAVSITASISQKYSSLGRSIGVIGYGNTKLFIEPSTGQSHFGNILENLAAIRAEGNTPLFDVLAKEDNLWASQSTLILITSSTALAWISALEHIRLKHVNIIVILLNANSYTNEDSELTNAKKLFSLGIKTYVVDKESSVEAALSKPYIDASASLINKELKEPTA